MTGITWGTKKTSQTSNRPTAIGKSTYCNRQEHTNKTKSAAPETGIRNQLAGNVRSQRQTRAVEKRSHSRFRPISEPALTMVDAKQRRRHQSSLAEQLKNSVRQLNIHLVYTYV